MTFERFLEIAREEGMPTTPVERVRESYALFMKYESDDPEKEHRALCQRVVQIMGRADAGEHLGDNDATNT